jgi:hypothetical protein
MCLAGESLVLVYGQGVYKLVRATYSMKRIKDSMHIDNACLSYYLGDLAIRQGYWEPPMKDRSLSHLVLAQTVLAII